MGCDCRQKDLMKSMPRDIPTKHPKSTGSENIGPERADFGSVGMGEVGSLVATTLEFNEKSGRVNRRRASWDVRLAEERGLGSNSLHL